MNATQEHILALLRDAPAPATLSRIRALGEDDWRELIDESEVLGVSGLLLRRASEAGIDVPPLASRRLRQILEKHTARNLRMLKEFDRLVAALRAEGVDFMPFKGLHLCSILYKNIGERPTWDIDLLVPLADISKAVKSIEGTGYRSSRPYDLDLEVRNYHHVPAMVKRGAPPVEIHWTLLNPRFQNGLTWQELRERAVPQVLGESQVHVFAPADLLIYLCAHAAYQHIYIDSVRSLYDIKILIEREAAHLDWGAITARARTWGLANSVYLTLRLTQELLGLAASTELIERLRPSDFGENLLTAAKSRLLEHAATSPVVSAVMSKTSPWERFRGLWSRAMIPKSVLAGRYRVRPGSPKVYLYYFVRLLDLLRIHGRDLGELLFGRRGKKERAQQESQLIAYLKWWQ